MIPEEESGLRSELRTIAQMSHLLLGDIIPLDLVPFLGAGLGYAGAKIVDRVYSRLFKNRIEESKAPEMNLSEAKMAQAETKVGSFDRTRLVDLVKTRDNSFAVIALPVSSEIQASDLHKILQDFHRQLQNHPRKLFALSYAGELPQGFQEQIRQEFDNRVFVFRGEAHEIFPIFYAGKFSRMSKENAETAKELLGRASELAGQPATMNFLKGVSLVASEHEEIFNEQLFGISKQFVNKSLKMSPQDILGLQLLTFPHAASLENIQLLKEQPEEFNMQSVNGSLRFFFRSEILERLQALVQAARFILSAA